MRKSTFARKHHTPSQRDQILAAYRRSRLTQARFAAKAGISLSTLHLWLRKAAKPSDPARDSFVALPNVFAASAPVCRLRFPQGMILEIPAGFPVGELIPLLQTLHAS